MKQEWQEIIYVHPAVLYKSDIIELAKILLEGHGDKRCDLKANIGYEGYKQTLSSIAELENYSSDIPTNELSMEVTTWIGNNDIINGISLTMYYCFIRYQIYSDSEFWFLGKIAQLTDFFKMRKPWYSIINRIILFVGPILVASGFLLSICQIKDRAIIPSILFLCFSILMLIILYLSYFEKLYPYVRIHPYDKRETIFSYELFLAIISPLLFAVSIVETFIMPILP